MKRVGVITNASADAVLDTPTDERSLPELFRAGGLRAESIPVDSGSLPERMRPAALRAVTRPQ